MAWQAKPHYRYTLGQLCQWSLNGPVVWQEVIITISRTITFAKAVQRIELPMNEAKRLVRLMSADLY